jgi:hypothetical protein
VRHWHKTPIRVTRSLSLRWSDWWVDGGETAETTTTTNKRVVNVTILPFQKNDVSRRAEGVRPVLTRNLVLNICLNILGRFVWLCTSN